MKPEDAEEYTQALGQVVAGGWRQIALGQRLGVPEALGLTVQDWVKKRLGGYVKLSVEERKAAALELKAEGLKQREIGAVLGVTQPQIHNDLHGDKKLSNDGAASEERAAPADKDLSDSEPVETFAALTATNDVRERIEADAIREQRRAGVRQDLKDLAAREVAAPTGQYDVIVVDPPWPIEKIERDARPNQIALDYPTLTEDELCALELPAADRCHVWLWATHRFLPLAFRLLEQWALKYVCTFVWHKPGGFQPVGLPQFNCEFALYARKGAPVLLDTKRLPTCFEAPRAGHSAKPEEFYEFVRRVTGGRRLDMFNRRKIAGFDGYGNEAP